MTKRYRWLLVACLVFASGILALTTLSLRWATLAAQSADPVLVGAGDIARCDSTQDSETAKLLDAIDGTVFTLGDGAYPDGTLEEFTECYEPTWGRHKARTKPAPGNHEYNTDGAAGYYTYFGAAASPLDNNCTQECKGYYSYDLGAWHIVVLNSEIDHALDSEQVQWLRADLAEHVTTCTLAYWHKPRFSSGAHGSLASLEPLWQVLYEHGVDVVLNGHEHNYERFAPQNPAGQADPVRGIRQFVVGTGGTSLRPIDTVRANSEVRNSNTWGVLKLSLHPESYDWEFIPIAGQTFRDVGSAACVRNTVATSTPRATATAAPRITPTKKRPVPPTATPTPLPSFTFHPIADAYVSSSDPTANRGAAVALRVDAAGPVQRSYVRFNVRGVTGPIARATLRLFWNSGSTAGYTVHTLSGPWNEGTVTYNTALRIGATPSATSSQPSAGNPWAEADVTHLIAGDGVLDLALLGISSTGVNLSSSEGVNPPQLVIEIGSRDQTSAAAAMAPAYDLASEAIDRDSDGAPDVVEAANRTNPTLPDTDGDGLGDLWEIESGLSPLNATGTAGELGDPDRDGVTNLEEQRLDTDPLAPNANTTFLPFVNNNFLPFADDK
jgi:hypothetical protein